MIRPMADKRVKGFSGDFGFGPSDHPEQKELPFRIMAVGNFSGANRSGAREPAVIDAHDFDKVLGKFWPRLVFEVENHLGSGRKLEIDFTPSTLKDFEPANVAARIPALAPVADFLKRTKALADGTLKPADFKRDLAPIQAVPALRDALDAVLDKIGPPTGSGQAARGKTGDVSVDAIFDMVDTKKKDSGGSAIDSFAASLGGGQKGIDVGAAVKLAEKLLEKQLAPVLGHAALGIIERNWRGLHALCKRGKGARIEVFDGDFNDWSEQVFKTELAGTNEAPLAMVVLADYFESTPDGVDRLREWGDACGQIQCAAVFDATALVGEPFNVLAARDNQAAHFEQPRYDQWRALRDKDESRWLCAALNQWWTGRTWASPVWLVAASVAQSMERTGWPSAHTGAADGEITGLQVIELEDRAEYPLESPVSDQALKVLAKSGFTPLMCQPNNDGAWVLLAPTVHKPSKAEEQGKLGTLAYQLLAARLGEMIMRAKSALVVAGNMEASAQNFAKFLSGLLANTGPGANIDISAQGPTLVLNIRTGREILGGVEIQLGVGT
jgi:type VI secretion system protein ImpB